MKNFYRLNIVLLTLFLLALTVIAQEYSYDYENMKMDEYKTELAKWQKCEADNKAAIAEEEGKIATLNDEIATLDQQYGDVWNEIYGLLGTTEEGYNDYLNQLKALENDLSGFVALSPEDIYTRKDELDGFKKQLADLKKNKCSLTSESQNYISRIENLIAQAEEKGKPAAAGLYEVQRGDYLWRIARKPDIYGDPYAWIKIYTYNRDQISDPNLIYPNQTFRIPRIAGPDEHWVERGEFLYKIAGYSNIYGNPFQWQKIYEANKTVITDPNLIYPHMVLRIPKN
jgi:nucleoid-associated protein YgaU